jgi:type I restriction enzyme M protein
MGSIMSEELIQRRLTEHGLAFGPYEFYNIGSTTITQLRDFKIIPSKAYKGFSNNKPDNLLVDRRDRKAISVILVLENKSPEEFNTSEKKEKAIRQCIHDYCKPLGARIGIVTDGAEYIWINPQLDGDGYNIILREDGYPLHLSFLWDGEEAIAQSLEIVMRILADISTTNSRLRKEELQNPSILADRVWQTIWLASGENPDACLATFVEIFVFKYLSDLGVIAKNRTEVGISFSDVLEKDRDRCLIFYFEHVRTHIKHLFPPGQQDDTSIINGIVLNPEVHEHNLLFYKILEEFKKFGSLRNIEPEFKSRLYENFLKKSISQKNWGQFFTPRNIVKAIIEMSEIEQLGAGAKVHDPACGVGGFILEPILTKRSRDYRFEKGRLQSHLQYSGYDRDLKTIILAKANMLIHLNELLRVHATSHQEFARVFNETFISRHTSTLGSLSDIVVDEYDLIMTNPPFVTTGTSKLKDFVKESGKLKHYYSINASGVEGLFVEKIIRSLKPGGKAFVIVPDGIMNRGVDSKLRKFILNECILEGVISLPQNAFYTTPKKTYIMVLTKKHSKKIPQVEPVFTYLVVNTGETLDTNRFETTNDLPEMVRLFKYFKASKQDFSSPINKAKVWGIERFTPDDHWSVDRWWTEEEQIKLGLADEKNLITVSDFTDRLQEEKRKLDEQIRRLQSLGEQLPRPKFTVELELSNEQYFELFIGDRVVKKEMYYGSTEAKIPLFSANVNQPFGMLPRSNITSFDHDFVLWGIDGNFDVNVMRRGNPFATTDHCGAIRIIDSQVDADYLAYYLASLRSREGFDRQLRPNLKKMKKLVIQFPVKINPDGSPQAKPANKPLVDSTPIHVLDIETQKEIAVFYKTFEAVKREIAERTKNLLKFDIRPLT